MTSDLREVAAEAGGPAALGAGPHAAHVLLTEDLVAALRVGAPRQVGAALHVASEQGVFILPGRRRRRRRRWFRFKHIKHNWFIPAKDLTGSLIRTCLTAATHHVITNQSQNSFKTNEILFINIIILLLKIHLVQSVNQRRLLHFCPETIQ